MAWPGRSVAQAQAVLSQARTIQEKLQATLQTFIEMTMPEEFEGEENRVSIAIAPDFSRIIYELMEVEEEGEDAQS